MRAGSGSNAACHTAAVVRYSPEPVTLTDTLGLFRSLLVIVIVPLNGPVARGANLTIMGRLVRLIIVNRPAPEPPWRPRLR